MRDCQPIQLDHLHPQLLGSRMEICAQLDWGVSVSPAHIRLH